MIGIAQHVRLSGRVLAHDETGPQQRVLPARVSVHLAVLALQVLPVDFHGEVATSRAGRHPVAEVRVGRLPALHSGSHRLEVRVITTDVRHVLVARSDVVEAREVAVAPHFSMRQRTSRCILALPQAPLTKNEGSVTVRRLVDGVCAWSVVKVTSLLQVDQSRLIRGSL